MLHITKDSKIRNDQVFLSEDEWEHYEERAAILEYEAGYDREEAEKKAYHSIVLWREDIRIAG